MMQKTILRNNIFALIQHLMEIQNDKSSTA